MIAKTTISSILENPFLRANGFMASLQRLAENTSPGPGVSRVSAYSRNKNLNFESAEINDKI